MVPTESRWQQLSPWPLADDERLQAIAAYLAQPESQAELEQYEQTRQYPQRIREQLHELGIYRFFAEPVDFCLAEMVPAEGAATGNEPTVTMAHIAALSQLMASVSTSLAITVAVNPLALLPVYIGASQAQLQWIFARVESGAYCSILLTELANGSNLLRTNTSAEAGMIDATGGFVALDNSAQNEPTHYQLTGRKDLINGGSQHDLLTIFARTNGLTSAAAANRPPTNSFAARSDFSIFVAERDETVESPYRWQTLPAPAADISSIEFSDTIVPAEQRIEREGKGLMIIQKTLAVSRGGVSALAAGLASQAVALSWDYARKRDIYGEPILRLGAITDHLLQMQALELLVSAMSVKATAAINSRGYGALHYAGVAKVACCTLTEELVNQGRLIHGGRALLVDSPYQRLIGDVLLYATFDGTVHVVLEQIQAHLAQTAASALTPPRPVDHQNQQSGSAHDPLAEMMTIYGTPPQSLIAVTRQRTKPLLLSPIAYLQALDEIDGSVALQPLLGLAKALLHFVAQCQSREIWQSDQGLRFEAAMLFANLETLIATVELADPVRRVALGMMPVPEGGPSDEPFGDLATLFAYTYGWFGGRLAATLRTLIARTGTARTNTECTDTERTDTERTKLERTHIENLAMLDEADRAFGELFECNRKRIRQSINAVSNK